MNTDLLYAIALGIGLSASCGFRVFVPLFLTSTLSYFGKIDMVPGFDWMNSLPAVISFGVASLVELTAYYIPIVDHILDLIAAPLSIAAGTLLSASFLTDFPPAVQWGLGIIVGGGTAGTIQMGTTMARLTSTSITAGIGNHLLASIENIISIIGTLVSFFIPIIVAVIFCIVCSWFTYKYFFRRKSSTASF